MSEAAPESTGTGTAQLDDGSQGTGTDPESSDTLTGTDEGGADTAAELAHWKEMARKNESRARENSRAARELAELKKQGMTDLEKAQAERDEAKRERDEARADHARIMAAATNDLPTELIDFLGTGTDEEINDRAAAIAAAIETRATELAEARADQIVRERTEQSLQQPGMGRNGARPVESMRAGSAPSGGAEPRTSDEWFRSLYQRD